MRPYLPINCAPWPPIQSNPSLMTPPMSNDNASGSSGSANPQRKISRYRQVYRAYVRSCRLSLFRLFLSISTLPYRLATSLPIKLTLQRPIFFFFATPFVTASLPLQLLTVLFIMHSSINLMQACMPLIHFAISTSFNINLTGWPQACFGPTASLQRGISPYWRTHQSNKKKLCDCRTQHT